MATDRGYHRWGLSFQIHPCNIIKRRWIVCHGESQHQITVNTDWWGGGAYNYYYSYPCCESPVVTKDICNVFEAKTNSHNGLFWKRIRSSLSPRLVVRMCHVRLEIMGINIFIRIGIEKYQTYPLKMQNCTCRLMYMHICAHLHTYYKWCSHACILKISIYWDTCHYVTCYPRKIKIIVCASIKKTTTKKRLLSRLNCQHVTLHSHRQCDIASTLTNLSRGGEFDFF